MAALTPGTRVGPYEILALIGSGGMGEVYRARDARLERDVAIKVLNPHKDQDYFCEGMAEELINALASLPGLRVVSRTSSFQFKGRAIDIGEVAAGNRMRIAVQLVDTADGYHLWSERSD